MANKILHKRSSVGAKTPLTSDLDYGELAVNYNDVKLYVKTSTNTIACVNDWAYITSKPTGLDTTATDAATASTIAKRDANGTFSVSAPTANAHVATKQYVDDNSGGGTWGSITGTIGDQTDLASALSAKQATSEKNAANGYAGLDANTRVSTAQLGTGTANSTTYLRGDGSWQVVSGGGGATLAIDESTNSNAFYPAMATATSGSWSDAYVANTKLYFNPSTGRLNATEFNALSDSRLKQFIVPIPNGLEKVAKLTGVEFEWRDNNCRSAGIIAQDLEAVLPCLVNTNIETGYKSVNYDGVIGLLVQAINELSNEVRKLRGE